MEIKKVTAETLKEEIERMERLEEKRGHPLALSEVFHLHCMRQLYAVIAGSPVELRADTDSVTDDRRRAFIASMADTSKRTMPVLSHGSFPGFLKDIH